MAVGFNFGEVFSKAVERVLSLVYSKDKKYERIVLCLFLIGFILRLVAGLHLDVFADDSIYASQSAGIIDAKILSTHSHPPLFSYLTDLSFKIFGYSMFASRFISIIAGALLIPLIFLISKRFFDEKIALFAATFACFSNFMIKLSVSEHSNLVFFLGFFGIYFGLRYLDNLKKEYLYLCGILFGLSCLTKYNGFFILFSFLLFVIYDFKMKNYRIFTKDNGKKILTLGFIILIFCMPFIAFNYFIYKEKGILDFQFTEVLKPEKSMEIYRGLAGVDKEFIPTVTSLNTYSNYDLIYKTDLVMFLIGLFGLYISYKQNKRAFWFLSIILIAQFILQSWGSTLAKHFLFIHIIFSICAGVGMSSILSKFNLRYAKIGLTLIVLALIVFNLGNVSLGAQPLLSKSGTAELKGYLNANSDSKSLIVFDTRIYSAKIFFFAIDRNFLTLQQFVHFYNYQENLSSVQKTPTKVLFVECVTENCGWGRGLDSQTNRSSEEIINYIAKQAGEPAIIENIQFMKNEFIEKGEKNIEYKVYELNMPLNSQIVEQTKNFQAFYFVPYLYKNLENYIFSYSVDGINSLIEKISLWIIYISMLLAILSFIAVIVLL